MNEYEQQYLIDLYSSEFDFNLTEKERNSIITAYEIGTSIFGKDKIDFEKLCEISIHNFKLDKKYPYLNVIDSLYNKIRHN